MNVRFHMPVFVEDPVTKTRHEWLGIGYIGAALKAVGVHVSASFCGTQELERAIRETEETAPDVVGLPVLAWNYHCVMDFSMQLKKRMPRIHITCGNKEASSCWGELMSTCPAIDSIVVGEGENTIVELVERLVAGVSLAGCLGLVYRDGDGIHRNAVRPLIEDLGTIHMPDRSLIRDTDRVEKISVITTRGCLAKCTFCETPFARGDIGRSQPGARVRTRDIREVLDEIEAAVAQYRTTYISFKDDTFSDGHHEPGGRFAELRDELRRRSLAIEFHLHDRAENINEAVRDVLAELKQLGLTAILLGMESGNSKDLRRFGKFATIEDNRRAVTLLHELGINVEAGFIMFNPYTDFQSLRENIDFLEEVKLAFQPHNLYWRVFLTSGAKLHSLVIKDGLALKTGLPVLDSDDSPAYLFRDARVFAAYKALQILRDEPTPAPIDLQGSWMLGLIRRYESLVGEDAESRRLASQLREYHVRHGMPNARLFRRILDLAEAGKSEHEILAELAEPLRMQLNALRVGWADIISQCLVLRDGLRDSGVRDLMPIERPACLEGMYGRLSRRAFGESSRYGPKS